ncbi:MAG: amidohydrolase family protein [Actinobacteria bacterium]|nr:amidohydrolase family protein [Actinomycetota bacterium]
MHDLVIRAGTVVDGTGAPGVTADVAIDDGIVTDVGRVGKGRREIDADGALVTPGFVDVHTHFDGQATWDPHLTPSCWHGVTTAVLGNCGVGFAPADPTKHDWLIGLMEGVEDIPGTALHEGMTFDWESFPEYLDALERMPRAIDIGTHVPHGAVRAYVMGERGARNEASTADDIAAMADIVEDALRAGALGFSTSRTMGHRAIDGEPVPGTFAAEDELFALGEALQRAGHGVFELAPAGTGGEAAGDSPDAHATEIDWMVRMAEATGVPVTFLVMQSHVDPDRWRHQFAVAREARAAGTPVYPQVASRCFGMLVGHQSRANPFRTRPGYQALIDLPFADRIARLRDPAVRARILAEGPPPATPGTLSAQMQSSMFDALYPMGDPADYEPTDDMTLRAIAAREGRTVEEVAYDAMLANDGYELLLYPLLNFGGGSYDALYEMMTDPITVQGLGDGGAHCGIVCDASMTTYLLSYWVRDRARGPRLELPTAVERLTRGPAALYGLHDRGVLAPGMRGDVNVIDFDGLGILRPEMVHDLPAGAGRMIQRSTGYVATVVAGDTVVDAGECTDAMPGGLIRGPQAGPGAAA